MPLWRSHPGYRVRLIAVVTALGLASCGGESADEAETPRAPSYDVATLGKQAFGPNARAARGRIAGRIETTITGVPGYDEPVVAAVAGPFSYRRGSRLPDFKVALQLGERASTLTAVDGKPYISLHKTGYALPPAARDRLLRSSAKGNNGLTRTLEQFGIAPWRWETKHRIAGTERIDGVMTVRIETGVDVGRFLRDANTLAGLLTSVGITRAAGVPPSIPPRARRILVRSVQSAKGASWIGVADKVMRRAGLTIRFAIPKSQRRALGGISAATVVARLNVTQVGRRQRIALPTEFAPFHNFALLLDALGDYEDTRPGR